MEGATKSKAGKAGLVPKPSKGDIRYLNSKGEWDDTPVKNYEELSEKIELLSSVVPVTEIPIGATLTQNGWVVTDDQEVSDEFALWED